MKFRGRMVWALRVYLISTTVISFLLSFTPNISALLGDQVMLLHSLVIAVWALFASWTLTNVLDPFTHYSSIASPISTRGPTSFQFLYPIVAAVSYPIYRIGLAVFAMGTCLFYLAHQYPEWVSLSNQGLPGALPYLVFVIESVVADASRNLVVCNTSGVILLTPPKLKILEWLLPSFTVSVVAGLAAHFIKVIWIISSGGYAEGWQKFVAAVGAHANSHAYIYSPRFIWLWSSALGLIFFLIATGLFVLFGDRLVEIIQ